MSWSGKASKPSPLRHAFNQSSSTAHAEASTNSCLVARRRGLRLAAGADARTAWLRSGKDSCKSMVKHGWVMEGQGKHDI